MTNPWLHRYAWLTACATLILIGIGGLVTSHGVGMSVPDWPTTYGYNMFLFPVSKWVGGIFYEHTHRLTATVVGVLVVGLTRWLGGRPSRIPLAVIGLVELAAGFGMLKLGPDWKGAGYFLSGIGGVVLLASAIWVRNRPAEGSLPVLGWLAFVLVQVQGLLGGLRVVLFKDQLGIFHAALAQLFFLLLCVIVVLTSRWWAGSADIPAGEFREAQAADREAGQIPLTPALSPGRGGIAGRRSANGRFMERTLFSFATLLIFTQLILGAAMRHQHAGLAIPDFPLAYGKLWPAMDPSAVESYNQHRLETAGENPITGRQIALQMVHRILAVLILATVLACALRAVRQLGGSHLLSRMALTWLGLIVSQVCLGAATIWSNKAADVATLHVITGALSLALGGIATMLAWRAQGVRAATPAELTSSNLLRHSGPPSSPKIAASY